MCLLGIQGSSMFPIASPTSMSPSSSHRGWSDNITATSTETFSVK